MELHGGRPWDGVGGSLKISADRKVTHGTMDITNAHDYVHKLTDQNIFLLKIKEKDIDAMKNEVSTYTIPPIKCIMFCNVC